MRILGIDEAGRGPAIGPMLIAGFLCDARNEQMLRSLGVRDSKKLRPQKRSNLEKRIKETALRYWIVEISVAQIDRMDLNTLELEAAAEIINEADVERIFMDAPVSEMGRDKFILRLNKILKRKIPMVIENKADDIFPCVSAASILAKVERDRLIEGLHKIYGDFGSGYPVDDKTQRFILNWHRYPEIVRKRWLPVRDAIVNKGKIMVVGAVDTGKTEFVRELVNMGLDKGMTVGVLDLDPGQSHIGPPGTLGFGVVHRQIRKFEQVRSLLAYPIFSLSPSGCEDRIIKGIEWLKDRIPQVDLLVIDTSGYTSDLSFKREKIRAINPERLVILERKGELEQLKEGLETIIYSIPVYERVVKKSKVRRRAFRDSRLTPEESRDIIHGHIKHE